MKVDYSKGKIYKITNDYNDDVFVGFTCDTLIKVFSKHKSDSNSKEKINKPLYKLIHEIGFERFRIQLILDFPCEDRGQLCQKTCECVRLYGKNLNLKGKEQVDLKKLRKEEKIRHEEETKRIETERIKKRGEKVECDCGFSYHKYYKTRHLQSKKHLLFMELLATSPKIDVVE